MHLSQYGGKHQVQLSVALHTLWLTSRSCNLDSWKDLSPEYEAVDRPVKESTCINWRMQLRVSSIDLGYIVFSFKTVQATKLEPFHGQCNLCAQEKKVVWSNL